MQLNSTISSLASTEGRSTTEFIFDLIPGSTVEDAKRAAAILAQADIFSEDDVRLAISLCQDFTTKLSNIVGWINNEGMTLTEIGCCLVVRDHLDRYSITRNASVAAIRSLLETVPKYSMTAPLGEFRRATEGVVFVSSDGISPEFMAILDALLEAIDSENFPLQRLVNVLDEQFNRDIYKAYRLAVEDPELFQAVAKGRRSAEEAIRLLVTDGEDLEDE